MDALWRTFRFSGADYATFQAFDSINHHQQSCTAIVASEADLVYQTPPPLVSTLPYVVCPMGINVDGFQLQPNWLRRRDIGSLAEVVNWTGTSQIFGSTGEHNTLAVLLCPQVRHINPRFRDDQPAILSQLPFDQATFQVVTERLLVHRALSAVLKGSSPTWSVIPVNVNNVAGEVYMLRSQGTLSGRMAVSITYLPGDARGPSNRRGSKMFAYYLGCSKEYADSIYSELEASRASAFSPFTLLKRFLEKERHNRLNEVDRALSDFETIIENFGFEATGDGENSSEEPKNMIRLYLRVCHLKNGLVAWKTQLEKMLKSCDKFRQMPGGSVDIDSEVYIQRLIEDYDIRINNCGTVMEGASLTFQMETSYQARNDTEIAIRDGKAMKTMAVVTTFFLPGTFFATLLAVPEFASLNSVTVMPPWVVYLVMFIPPTLVLMTYYILWVHLGSGRPVKRQYSPDD